MSTAEVYDRLEEMLELDKTGNTLNKYDSGELQYAVSDIQVYCSNVQVGARSDDVKLTFHVSAVMEIPVTFVGIRVVVQKPISLNSYYMPRF